MITTNDGVRLHVTDEGDGDAVVLIAGYTAPATSWAFQREALLDAGYRVVAIDRRNHGESDQVAHGQRIARHAQDVRQVLEALDVRDAVLVGGSMGASTIWSYVDLYGTDRVRAIVSIDQTPRMRNSDEWAYGYYGFDDSNCGTFFQGSIPQTGRGFTVEQQLVGLQRLVDKLGPKAGALRGGITPETLPLLFDHAQQDWRDVVERVEVPVLMLAGRDSQMWPCEHTTAMAERNPHVRAHVIEDCGHAANIDQPEAVNAAILEFLDR